MKQFLMELLAKSGGTVLLRNRNYCDVDYGEIYYLDALCEDDSVLSLAVACNNDLEIMDLYEVTETKQMNLDGQLLCTKATAAEFIHRFPDKASWDVHKTDILNAEGWYAWVKKQRNLPFEKISQYKTEAVTVCGVRRVTTPFIAALVLLSIRENKYQIKFLDRETLEYDLDCVKFEDIEDYRDFVEYGAKCFRGGALWRPQ